MPNVISKGVGAAVYDVVDLQDPTHEDNTKWHVNLIDEDGNNVFDLGMTSDEIAENMKFTTRHQLQMNFLEKMKLSLFMLKRMLQQ
jgi:hypothetical protein